MSDKFVERYFANLKQEPADIKKDYEEIVGDNPKPGVRVIKDTGDRYSAVYTDEKTGTSYLIDEFDELATGDFPARKTEFSYKDVNGNFVNVGERAFFDGSTVMTYTGFIINEAGDVVNLGAEQAKNNFDGAQTAIENIRELQNVTATTPTIPTAEA